MSSSSSRRGLGTSSATRAASNLPHGVPRTAHKNRNASILGSR